MYLYTYHIYYYLLMCVLSNFIIKSVGKKEINIALESVKIGAKTTLEKGFKETDLTSSKEDLRSFLESFLDPWPERVGKGSIYDRFSILLLLYYIKLSLIINISSIHFKILKGRIILMVVFLQTYKDLSVKATANISLCI